MPPCPPPRAQISNTQLFTLMGEPCIQGDMDLTWQEILSIAELQGLDVQCDSTYDTAGYGTPAMPVSGYGLGNFPDGMTPNLSHSIQTYDQPYLDTNCSQPQPMPPLPSVPAFGPNTYTGMLFSSSINQMGTMAPSLTKSLPVTGLFNAPILDHITMPDVGLVSANSIHHFHKSQEDFESDSGLSLNFSDGESMEFENMESQRLQSEYMEMVPSLAYQDHYGVAPTLTQPISGHITDAHSYSISRTQELVCSRDERRAAAMNIPFPTERIVNLPVEDFNELLSQYTLTEAQMALVRDIRRRGKNKVAAQNCRKRKMENIASLEKEIGQLQTEREGLRREREEVGRVMGDLKKELEHLQQEVLTVLRAKGSSHCQLEDLMCKQTSDCSVYHPN
ncbi:transcription factor NF-E2 45 kDa subunit [Rhinophrynus dorsalis]